jgi:hypothetical protein
MGPSTAQCTEELPFQVDQSSGSRPVLKAEYHHNPHFLDNTLAHDLSFFVEVLHQEVEFKSTTSLPSGGEFGDQEQDPDAASRKEEARMKTIFKDWAKRREEAKRKALGNSSRRNAYMRAADERLVQELTAEYDITHEELDRIEAYGAAHNWW